MAGYGLCQGLVMWGCQEASCASSGASDMASFGGIIGGGSVDKLALNLAQMQAVSGALNSHNSGHM